MPPKRRKPPAIPSNSTLVDISQDNPELMQKFEVELCWCIENLQKALKSGKLTEKQVEKYRVNLNILMSNSSPVIMKKQVMRLTFGDYRARMAEEQKKSKSSVKCKVSPATPSKKSVFMKKSLLATTSNNSFKFNFDVPSSENSIEDELSKVKIESSANCKKSDNNFHFTVSNNGFRFNFTNEELT